VKETLEPTLLSSMHCPSPVPVILPFTKFLPFESALIPIKDKPHYVICPLGPDSPER
jgi:hypothetical protein